MSNKNNEMIPANTGFLALADFNMNEGMAEELDGLEGGFDRVKIPAGGATMFELPGDEADEPETVKEFSAVILFHHPILQYYKEKYTGGSNPPDCGSFDGVNGEGDPGGACANCPLNQFGSGENNSKACKTRRRVFLLREGELFPLILSLPTGSMKEFSRYIKRLLSKGKKSNMVVTRFSLKKATNNSGIGVFFGLFPRGLQKTLKFKAGLDTPLSDCERIIANLKSGYPQLSLWQEVVKRQAAARRYSETWLGRRRYLPNITSEDWGKKSFAERCAMNTPIQGTAADILKLALARLIVGLRERPWLKPLLQIHDELVFELPADKAEEAAAFIRSCMEDQPFPEFDVPIIAEGAFGPSFGSLAEME